MTTIVTDGKTIAWDSQITVGDTKLLYPRHKVEFVRGKLIGLAGGTPSTDVMAKWYEAGCPKDKLPSDSFEMLVIERDASVFYLCNEGPYPTEVQAPFGIGSGSGFALPLMAIDIGATEACAVACRLDPHSSGPVYSFEIAKALRRAKERIPTEYEVDDVIKLLKEKRA